MRRFPIVPAFLLLLFVVTTARAQDLVVPLWPNGAPGSEGRTEAETVRITEDGEHIISSVHRPSIAAYVPEEGAATGAAVVVIPGGGHRELWMDHEGYRVAEWLRARGVAAFVLKYRLARAPESTYTVEGESLADVRRAVRLVRSRSGEWGIDPERIGVIGFSAGGQLAALAGTRYQSGRPDAADPIERESSRPAFMGLVYPAIPADMELTDDTPPAFLLCGEDDSPRIAEGVARLYLEMKAAAVPVELHIFTGVGHGFGMRYRNPPAVATWPEVFVRWLEALQLL